MKIVDRETFLKLPSQTLFSKYKPCRFEGLEIKISEGAEWINDYVVQEITAAVECNSSEDFTDKCIEAEKGAEIKLDFDCGGRDGFFDKDQLFAVWSKYDVKQLIQRLHQCL